MKKNISIGLILGALSLLLSSCSGNGAVVAGQIGEKAVITATGLGEVHVVPDIGYINVGVRSQGATVTEAIAVNNELAKSIQASLMGQGIDEK